LSLNPVRRKASPMSATATKPANKSAKKKATLIPLGDRVVVEREQSE